MLVDFLKIQPIHQSLILYFIETAKCRYITEEKNRELKRSCLHPGDIVVTKTGVYFGKSAVIPESIPEANTIAHVGKIH